MATPAECCDRNTVARGESSVIDVVVYEAYDVHHYIEKSNNPILTILT